MSAVLGTAAVALGLAAAVLGMATLAIGLRRNNLGMLRAGQRYVWLVLAGALLATAAMQYALLSHDFSLKYVADNGSRSTPLLYTVTTMWSALEGSILLWALVLAGYIAVMARHFRARASDPIVAWATLVALGAAAFFFGLMAGPANPFRLVAGAIPLDGPGPNPLLQNHPLVAFHPPMLYLGYVGFTIPFAFALAALITGRVGESWLVETRRWTLFAWGFLTVGIVLGAWWSYEVLGWGGYWAWDPVENASFLPWLTATAYVHSVMVQERRSMLRVWNLSLLVATFSLTILGTFLTRSGVLDSVHAFTESPIGPAILGFFAVVVAVSVGLIGWRGDKLRSPGSIDAPVSREAAFLANNVAFAAFAFVVLLGTIFPLLAFGLAAFAGAAALRHLGLSVRAARRAGQPMWRALMGRSNGGMVVHLGVVLIAVGFAASSSYGHRAQFRLAPGESASLAGHSVTYLGTTVTDAGNKKTTSAQVRVDGGKVYEPALHQFPFGSQAIGSPSVRTGPLSDVYLTLIVPPDAGGVAVIGVNIQPLVVWLWTGGAVMGFGTFLAAWPGRRRRPASPQSEPVSEPDPVRPEPAVISS